MIKTYPLQFTKEELDKIREVANQNDESVKEFILKAIAERMRENDEKRSN